jgi:hypothetical protein
MTAALAAPTVTVHASYLDASSSIKAKDAAPTLT